MGTQSESENSLTSSGENEEETSGSFEGSEESSSDSTQQRILPSRRNRGSKMRFLLSNARLIAESRADKGYKRLFSDGDTSDSMNDSEEYTTDSNTTSDSFDSDFDDEAKGKIPVNLSSSGDSSGDDEPKKKIVRKVPKRFRGGRPKVVEQGGAPASTEPIAQDALALEPTVSPENTELPESSLSTRPKRTIREIPFSPPESGNIAREEKKVELLAERRARLSKNMRKSPVADVPLAKRKRKVRVNATASQTQEERMQNAMRMREQNLAILASESVWNEEEAMATQSHKKSLREKWPFYFYEPSGYRRIEKAEWVQKYGTTTLYMFPMCSSEYNTLFSKNMTQCTSELQALSQRRLERSLVPSTEPQAAGVPSRYKYHYSQEPLSNSSESTNALSNKFLVPYPLRFGASVETSAKPAKRAAGVFAKDGKIKFGKKFPNSRLLGCKGPYREPFTGIFYATRSQYDEIMEALRRIREFWRSEGYPQEWTSTWGNLNELNKQRSLRWALMPYLVKIVRETTKGKAS